MRLVGCVCWCYCTSSVQSDCLWKELVLSAGACSAYGNSVSSPWFGWLESQISNAVLNVTAVKFSQGAQTTQTYHLKCLPLQLLVFCVHTRWPNSNPMTGLPLVFLIS